MKFKILLLAIIFIGQNLYPFEPLTPSKASKKTEELGQLDWIINSTNDYGLESKPSFACYDTKGNYKFKKYSLEDFICQSDYNSFRDNYFADLYNLIIKEAPNLKEKAQKIARERIAKTQKECMIYSQKDYINSIENYPNPDVGPGYIHMTINCIKSHYRSSTAKLALMLYESDKELFKRIYGEDYEKFKEVFEDTLKYIPIIHSTPEITHIRKTDNAPYAEFLKKYDDYTGYYDEYHIYDLIYIVLVQYSLLDENGHLVLPEERKEEGE